MKNSTRIVIITLILVVGILAIISLPREDRTEATTAETTTEEPTTEEPTTEEPTTEEPTTEETTTAETTTEEPTTEEPTTAAPSRYTDAELEVLAIVIYQEAGGDACSNNTRLKVATVVMNRVEDPRFPNSITAVVLAPGQYGTLSSTGLVWPSRAHKASETTAVARAYAIAERVLNGERALPSDVVWQAEFPQGTEVVAHQDGLYFCR